MLRRQISAPKIRTQFTLNLRPPPDLVTQGRHDDVCLRRRQRLGCLLQHRPVIVHPAAQCQNRRVLMVERLTGIRTVRAVPPRRREGRTVHVLEFD